MSAPGTILPVLMALRVKGRAEASSVAVAAGISPEGAEAALAYAGARGLAESAGASGLHTMTQAGRAELSIMLAAEAIDREALAAAYGDFLAVDGTLKRKITEWQLLERSERNPERGGAALAGIRAAGAAARVVSEHLVAVVARLAPYAERLVGALRQLAAGDDRFVASPHVDSLHQVWFELHEDLLVTLGRERRS